MPGSSGAAALVLCAVRDSLLGTPSPSRGWGMSQPETLGHFWLSTSMRREYDVECGGSAASVRRPKALQQFRRGEGETDELLLVDGGDQRFVDWREGGLFLGEIRVKVVDVFRRFLGTTDRQEEGRGRISNVRSCSRERPVQVTMRDGSAEGFHRHLIDTRRLTILGLKGGSNPRRFSFSQSIAAKKAWLTTASSPPSEATQPRRRAGFLVNSCGFQTKATFVKDAARLNEKPKTKRREKYKITSICEHQPRSPFVVKGVAFL